MCKFLLYIFYFVLKIITDTYSFPGYCSKGMFPFQFRYHYCSKTLMETFDLIESTHQSNKIVFFFKRKVELAEIYIDIIHFNMSVLSISVNFCMMHVEVCIYFINKLRKRSCTDSIIIFEILIDLFICFFKKINLYKHFY